MKVIIILFSIFLTYGAIAQSGQGLNQNLPFAVTVQFHSLAVPFHNLKSNFKNIGIGIGTELDYGRKSDFHQRFSLIWYCNQAVGNGLLLQSQAIWRPSIGKNGYGELKAGGGYLLSKSKPTTKGILPLRPLTTNFAISVQPPPYSAAGFQFCGNNSCSLLTL